MVNSVRSVDEGKALAAELPDAVYVQADVSREEQARSLVSAAVDRWGRLDIVVNNAGAAVMLDHRDLDGLTDAMWRAMLDVNLMSAWYLSRAAVPALSVAGGSIVNISSLAGVHPTGSGSSIAYAVAKAAVNHLTVLLANTLGSEGIRVNAIAVGPVETPMWGLEGDQIRAALRDRTLLGRPGRPGRAGAGLPHAGRPGLRHGPGAGGRRRHAIPRTAVSGRVRSGPGIPDQLPGIASLLSRDIW